MAHTYILTLCAIGMYPHLLDFVKMKLFFLCFCTFRLIGLHFPSVGLRCSTPDRCSTLNVVLMRFWPSCQWRRIVLGLWLHLRKHFTYIHMHAVSFTVCCCCTDLGGQFWESKSPLVMTHLNYALLHVLQTLLGLLLKDDRGSVW